MTQQPMKEFPVRRIQMSLALLIVCATIVSVAAPSGTLGVPLAHAAGRAPWLFQTSDNCVACHNQLSTASGEDVSIGTSWRATMMANSGRDPYWLASVRREVLEHPELQAEIEDECSTCHMPMSRYQAKAEGRHGTIFAHLPVGSETAPEDLLAADGVSCTVCHQITNERLGTPASFVGGFVIDEKKPPRQRQAYGPYDIDNGRARIMQSSSEFRPTKGEHIRSSELCATCHTLYTDARDAAGKIVGRLPEQVPYLEWQHSEYGASQSCQSCHMPAVTDSIAISGVWGKQRPGLARHEFLGGNFFMLEMLNRYRAALGTEALPQELDASAQRTIRHLQTATAAMSIASERVGASQLRADITVRNLAGHKFPTAYPARRAWIHFTVRGANGAVVFESGAVGADGAIVGADGDADGLKFEPHHREITRPDQVQIFESVMADAQGNVTTALLSGARFVKDNRILPRGFAKGSASADIAVRGDAADDPAFFGGSARVRYVVDLRGATGPFRVEAALAYQPISYRWARNLGKHQAPEITRFMGYYDAMAKTSSVVIALDSAMVR